MQLACRKICDVPKETSGRKTPASLPSINRKRWIPQTGLAFCWHRNHMQDLGRLQAQASLDVCNGYMQPRLPPWKLASCWNTEITAFFLHVAQLLPSWIVNFICSQSGFFKARLATSVSFPMHVCPSCSKAPSTLRTAPPVRTNCSSTYSRPTITKCFLISSLNCPCCNLNPFLLVIPAMAVEYSVFSSFSLQVMFSRSFIIKTVLSLHFFHIFLEAQCSNLDMAFL